MICPRLGTVVVAQHPHRGVTGFVHDAGIRQVAGQRLGDVTGAQQDRNTGLNETRNEQSPGDLLTAVLPLASRVESLAINGLTLERKSRNVVASEAPGFGHLSQLFTSIKA